MRVLAILLACLALAGCMAGRATDPKANPVSQSPPAAVVSDWQLWVLETCLDDHSPLDLQFTPLANLVQQTPAGPPKALHADGGQMGTDCTATPENFTITCPTGMIGLQIDVLQGGRVIATLRQAVTCGDGLAWLLEIMAIHPTEIEIGLRGKVPPACMQRGQMATPSCSWTPAPSSSTTTTSTSNPTPIIGFNADDSGMTVTAASAPPGIHWGDIEIQGCPAQVKDSAGQTITPRPGQAPDVSGGDVVSGCTSRSRLILTYTPTDGIMYTHTFP